MIFLADGFKLGQLRFKAGIIVLHAELRHPCQHAGIASARDDADADPCHEGRFYADAVLRVEALYGMPVLLEVELAVSAYAVDVENQKADGRGCTDDVFTDGSTMEK